MPLKLYARAVCFRISAFAAFSILALLVGCPSSPKSLAPAPAEKMGAQSVESRRVKIATFNIANLSLNKLKDIEVAQTLAAIVRKYDLIAVQEVDDKSLKAADALLEFVNRLPGDRYGAISSPETGLAASVGQKEQYAFFYNRRTIRAVGEGKLFPESTPDLFVREPFAVQFSSTSGGTSVVLLNIHTAPEAAAAEIAALRKAVDWASATFMGEEGVVVLGDFNAGERYVKPPQMQRIRNDNLPYLWIVPDDADTNLATGKNQAHDRIVVTGTFGRRYTNQWGVDRSFTSTKVSDHYPVWAEFDFSEKK